MLPLTAELAGALGFMADPVGDLASRCVPGVLQKYHGSALLIATGACAIHCRNCFRRHFPYGEQNASRRRWQETLDHLRHDASVSEVIVSGGDPLLFTDQRFGELLAQLARVPHVQRLRLHARVPIVLPERVDAEFCDWLERGRLTTVVVLHANHANEFDDTVRQACGDLRAAGATLLDQAVLLAGVNDSVSAPADLSTVGFDCGVLPYYLHLLDRVQGAGHFEWRRDGPSSCMPSCVIAFPATLCRGSCANLAVRDRRRRCCRRDSTDPLRPRFRNRARPRHGSRTRQASRCRALPAMDSGYPMLESRRAAVGPPWPDR